MYICLTHVLKKCKANIYKYDFCFIYKQILNKLTLNYVER